LKEITVIRNARLPEIGDLIDNGKYRIDSKIGEGAMGVVYGATHAILGNRVAIKWLQPKLSADETAVKRFLYEAKIAAKIEHPNVVRPIDISTQTDAPYIVMELLDGESLNDYLKDKRLSVEKASRIFVPVLRGVAAAHAKGIIHRDLKLSNIFLAKGAEGRTPKVLDFGIAKLVDSDSSHATLTEEGSTLGTILYMSPEQLKDPTNVTVQTDVYALGVILYRMLTGKMPYEGNILDLALRIHQGEAIPMTQWVDDIPADLDRVVMRAIANKRQERYPDVASFARALVPFFPGEQLSVFEQNRISDVDPLTIDEGRQVFEQPDLAVSDRSVQPRSTLPRGERALRTSLKPVADTKEHIGIDDNAIAVPVGEPPTTTVDEPSTFKPINIQPKRSAPINRRLLFGLGASAVAIGAVIAVVSTKTSPRVNSSVPRVPEASPAPVAPKPHRVVTSSGEPGNDIKTRRDGAVEASGVGDRDWPNPDRSQDKEPSATSEKRAENVTPVQPITAPSTKTVAKNPGRKRQRDDLKRNRVGQKTLEQLVLDGVGKNEENGKQKRSTNSLEESIFNPK
jgi:serine/threonine protein kinase